MSEVLIARLEAAVTRLEKLGGNAAVAASDDSDDIASPAAREAIEAFEDFYKASVTPFLTACAVYPDLANVATLTEQAFKNQVDLVKAAAVSKKPTDADLLAFLKPSADAIQMSDKMDHKSAQFTHQQAFNNSIGALSWPFAAPPASHIEGMLDSGSMYLNRILMKAKDAEEPQKSQDRAFVATYKALISGLLAVVKKHFKAGLEWNNIKGGALGAAPAAAAPAAAAPAPVAAPKPVAKPTGGMGSVFGQLNQGLAITANLSKVTDDMKAKNMTDAPVVVPKAAPKKVVPASAKPVVKKDPSFENANGSWYIEHYDGDHSLTVENATMTTGVYVGNCRNTTIKITGKPKSVTLDKCFRTTVYVEDVLSSVEFVNDDRCNVYITGICPTIAIDKSKGCIVHLAPKSRDANPDIVTSNISECNIQWDGETENDDIVEIPLAEQFINKINGKKIDVNPVSHG